jgi:hypothetical protein
MELLVASTATANSTTLYGRNELLTKIEICRAILILRLPFFDNSLSRLLMYNTHYLAVGVVAELQPP